MKKLCILLTFLISGCSAPKQAVITITPDGNKMSYLVKEFTVKKEQSVKLIMNNTADVEIMKHNVVIISDDSKIDEIGQQALTSSGYIPDNEAIIAATPMADAGKKTETTFIAPSKAGKYTFICTYPGHYVMMRGVMIVE